VLLLAMRLPAAKKKVETEMGKARLDIENQLVPKGANVTRHLALPEKGQTLEWILQEMDKMDNEREKQTNWRHGKLSGAVYRTFLNLNTRHVFMLNNIILFRWR
jgi:sphinganine-1-phosphate aldolase